MRAMFGRREAALVAQEEDGSRWPSGQRGEAPARSARAASDVGPSGSGIAGRVARALEGLAAPACGAQPGDRARERRLAQASRAVLRRAAAPAFRFQRRTK
jgi:hypothetical protein